MRPFRLSFLFLHVPICMLLQVLYHQLLVWGQIAVGLVICFMVSPYVSDEVTAAGSGNITTPTHNYLPVLVALGFEAGADISSLGLSNVDLEVLGQGMNKTTARDFAEVCV